jgi:hypothetical protein
LCFLGVLSFAVYFGWLSLEWGSGVHWMTSDGVYGGIEWLFQLEGDGGIEIVFQWFKVQCKMRNLHEICRSNDKANETKTHEVDG